MKVLLLPSLCLSFFFRMLFIDYKVKHTVIPCPLFVFYPGLIIQILNLLFAILLNVRAIYLLLLLLTVELADIFIPSP